MKPLNYYQYLQSLEWEQKRKEALDRARWRCQACNTQDDLHVHHRTYERLGYERDDDLTVLCRTCHNAVHGITISVSPRVPVVR